MPTPTEVRALVRNLGVERRRAPEFFPADFAFGVPLEPIRDPILRELAEFRDWREYQKMLRVPEVRDPIRHLYAAALAEPWEIQEGPSSSPAAAVLKDLAVFAWTSQPAGHRKIVLERILDADFFGWRPLQVILATARLNGRDVVIPKPGRGIVDKPPERFRFTRDGELVFSPAPVPARQLQVFDADETRAGWMTPSTRTLDSPYGEGLAGVIWPLFRVAVAFQKQFFLGVQREMGLPVVRGTQPRPDMKLSEWIEQVESDIAVMVEWLNSKNVLAVPPGMEVEFLHGLQFSDSGIKLREHLAKTIRLIIEGQHLTAETSTSGPAGSSRVQREVEVEYAKGLVELVEATVSELFATIAWLNEGDDIDPDDVPRFCSRLKLKIPAEALRSFVDFGAPILAKRAALLAGGEGLASVIRSDEEADEIEGDFLLRKRGGVDLQEFLRDATVGGQQNGGGEDEDDGEGGDRIARRELAVRTTVEERAERQLQELLAAVRSAGETVSPALDRRAREILAAWRQARPYDPKAHAPRSPASGAAGGRPPSSSNA